MNKPTRIMLVGVTAQIVAACAPTAPKPSVSQVHLSTIGIIVGVGQTLQIVPTVTTSPAGSDYTIVWTTSNSSYAVVDSTGHVTGIALSGDSLVSVCATASTGDVSMAVRTCAQVVVSNQTTISQPE